MPNLGVTELAIILVIVIVLFGVKRLPQLGKGLGEGIHNFRQFHKDVEKGMKEGEEEEK